MTQPIIFEIGRFSLGLAIPWQWPRPWHVGGNFIDLWPLSFVWRRGGTPWGGWGQFK